MCLRRSARRTATVILAVGVLGFAVPVSAPASAQPEPASAQPEDLAAATVAPALVYIETYWVGYVYDEEGEYFNDGNPFEFSASCTGFGVSADGHVATAGHCVDDTAGFGGVKRDLIEIAAEEAHEEGTYAGAPSKEELLEFGLANWTVEGSAKGSPVKREVFAQRSPAAAGERTGDAMPAEVVDFRAAESGDVALLKVDTSALPSVMVSDLDTLEVGTPLLSLGFPSPAGESLDDPLRSIAREGTISAEKKQRTNQIYEVSTAIASGMSGGPAANLAGEVIGINSSRVGAGGGSNFIVPARNLLQVMERNEVENRLGRVDEIYREGLTAFYSGNYAEAIASFDRVLDLDPRHVQAEEFRQTAAQTAAQAIAEGGETAQRRIPVIPVGIGVLLLAAVGGTAFVRPGRRWSLRR